MVFIFTFLQADSYKFYKIKINADFTLKKHNLQESKIKTYTYKYGLFYNNEYTNKMKKFCFYSDEFKNITLELKKPNNRICISNDDIDAYYLDSLNKYSILKEYEVGMINMYFTVINTKNNKTCSNSSINYKDFNEKISQCIGALKIHD